MELAAFARPEWEPLPFDGCHGVKGKVLLVEERLTLALLRFSEHATIHEHSAPFAVDVCCLDGRGLTSVAGEESTIETGQRVRWPTDLPHRLWTDGSAMTTLMVERRF